jgi:hypothetical protein
MIIAPERQPTSTSDHICTSMVIQHLIFSTKGICNLVIYFSTDLDEAWNCSCHLSPLVSMQVYFWSIGDNAIIILFNYCCWSMNSVWSEKEETLAWRWSTRIFFPRNDNRLWSSTWIYLESYHYLMNIKFSSKWTQFIYSIYNRFRLGMKILLTPVPIKLLKANGWMYFWTPANNAAVIFKYCSWSLNPVTSDK